MERVLVFLDFANVEIPARDRGGLDYAHLLQYLAEGRFLVDGYCYLPIDPRRQMERVRTIESLWEQGWNVQPKLGKLAGDACKCNMDVEIAIDMLRTAHDIRPDIMVLCSGDEDFLPVVHAVRRMGIRVEAAAFESVAARRLRREASGFISLDAYLRDWRQASAAQTAWEAQDAADPAMQGADDAADPAVDPEITGDAAEFGMDAADPVQPAAGPDVSDGELPDAARYR